MKQCLDRYQCKHLASLCGTLSAVTARSNAMETAQQLKAGPEQEER